ncbi:ABC transporter permease [Pseudoteredinibacter isoporae]|uniref:Putative ABC transport system permease protein n=1 Tax=Pseudoteredinibacter isoporae TaxID=570281 RepID=A0A7X0JUV1_9GAMM|nr:FtsX-like permease family protein [Pseudoteredinibacter isoporae]MBB6521816.1 putative ABC transport system permease protein [Pseudoteredinibacter isoporae]NHO87361.1 FtsX-like permease family protein [Pseudoteredinibacter isoporae]NIB23185.1 FtsX-like permease family protein [Pseudoteredinibacter isoporae]
MALGPIFRSTLRNPTGAVLIALQIALTLAIASNTFYMVKQRIDKMNRDTGVVNEELLTARVFYFGATVDQKAQADIDRKTLMDIPGVKSVSYSNSIPLGGSNNTSSLCFEQEMNDGGEENCPHSPSYYRSDVSFHETMGLKLLAGRWLNESDAIDSESISSTASRTMLLSDVLAKLYFPEESAVGKQLYLGGRPLTVVGVYERMLRPGTGGSNPDHTILAAEPQTSGYLSIRIETDRIEQVKAELEATMVGLNDQRVVSVIRTLDEVAERTYRRDKAMVVLLLGVVALLLVVTALGVAGLVSFTVANRKKQIGTRRALGASKRDILGYFMSENFAITATALLLGGFLAYALNQYLLQSYQLSRLELVYVFIAAGCLLFISQMATLLPALRASRVSPAIATRTV